VRYLFTVPLFNSLPTHLLSLFTPLFLFYYHFIFIKQFTFSSSPFPYLSSTFSGFFSRIRKCNADINSFTNRVVPLIMKLIFLESTDINLLFLFIPQAQAKL